MGNNCITKDGFIARDLCDRLRSFQSKIYTREHGYRFIKKKTAIGRVSELLGWGEVSILNRNLHIPFSFPPNLIAHLAPITDQSRTDQRQMPTFSIEDWRTQQKALRREGIGWEMSWMKDYPEVGQGSEVEHTTVTCDCWPRPNQIARDVYLYEYRAAFEPGWSGEIVIQ